MSSIVGAITGSGGQGMAYRAGSGDIINPYGNDKNAQLAAQAGQRTVTGGVNQQQAFLQALQGQNGIQNQSNVFNQLQNVANGQGPNPAQAMLNNATGTNVANQAALMAGQRGTSANPGLLARQIAQQGAATQQQSAGQGAALQAQQSLNAIGQMGNVANTQVGQQQNALNSYNNAAQGAQGQVLGAISGLNGNNVNMQSNMNSVNGQLANTVAGAQANLVGNLTGGLGSALAFADGGTVQQPGLLDQAISTVKSAFEPPKKPLAPTPAPTPVPSKAKAISNVFGGNGYAEGGEISFDNPSTPRSRIGAFLQQNPNLLSGPSTANNQQTPMGTAGTMIGKALGSGINYGVHAIHDLFSQGPVVQGPQAGGMDASQMPQDTLMAAEGGQVPALVSPGEKYLTPKDVKKVEKGANPLEVGEKIPGKPKVGGAKNDYANDTVPKTLEEGGIVLPRSVTQAKHPQWEAHRFVSAIMAKQGKSLPKKSK